MNGFGRAALAAGAALAALAAGLGAGGSFASEPAVLPSGLEGIRAVMIVEAEGSQQGGRMHTDLRGRLLFELGGVVLALRDERGWSIDRDSGKASALDATMTRRLELHDFLAIALRTRHVFALMEPIDDRGRSWRGEGPRDEHGTLQLDERGRVSNFEVFGPEGAVLEVRFLEWRELGEVEVPVRIRTVDEAGVREYRLSGLREEPMPESGSGERPSWQQEERLPVAARNALAAERAFALHSRTQGMKSAFLEWLAPGATVFAPQLVTVEQRFADVPDALEEQPALEWLPEWIVTSAAGDLAAISGRWNLRAPGAEHPDTFGQYLSVWKRRAEGWRVLADIGTSQPDPRPLTPRATGRVVEARAPRAMVVPDAAQLADTVENGLEQLAFRDGYLTALRELAAPEVIVLRDGEVVALGPDGLDVSSELVDLAPRIEVTGSAAAASHDLLAVWGRLEFEPPGAPRRFAFLRVWQLETSRWQVAADALLALP